MPMGTRENLDALYAKQNLVIAEAARLETERDSLDPDGADANAHYLLELKIVALRQESTRISSRVSEILDRDLQR
jgi:hypothetical protein